MARIQAFRCSKRRLSRADLALVAANLDAFESIGHSWQRYHEEGNALSRYVGHSRVLNAKNEQTVRTWRLRGFREEATRPVEARSDEGAAVERLWQVTEEGFGGRCR